jgi:predicted Holliday junction resolvase-like endonuclease
MDPLMTVWVFFIGSFFGIILGVMLSYRTAVTPLRHTISKLTSQDQQYQENMKYYPYDQERFRLVGGPVDGIQFGDDSILFVRFKQGNVPCTEEQEKIKKLLETGNVQWFEFIIK